MGFILEKGIYKEKGILGWYPFRENAECLNLDNDNIAEESSRQYDYVICNRLLERVATPDRLLNRIADLLKEDGKLVLLMNNRLGLRFFCGDKGPYTNEVMDVLYKRNAGDTDRLYSKAEIIDLLSSTGFLKYKFYSVFSNLDNPTHIFAHDYKPNEDIANRLYPAYDSPDTVFLEEEQFYRDLIDNNLFHSMANGFLVEASLDEKAAFSDVLQVTSTLDRDPENAFFTIIHKDGTVTKENAYPQGKKRFEYMLEYASDLREHHIDVVDMETTEKGISMPYIDAPTGQLAMKEDLLSRGKEAFFKMTDAFRDCIMKSSEIIEDDVKLGPIAKFGYIDMVPLNSFYMDGKFTFFDQEFRIEHYPFNAIISRMIATFFFGNENLKSIVSMDEVYARYGILDNKDLFLKMEWDFLSPLRNEEALAEYHSKVRRNNELTVRNRKRMNFSADEYLQIFSEVFEGCRTKNVYVFGAGSFAERFMDWYGKALSVKGILDNNSDRWGEYLQGVKISAPEMIKDVPKGSYKVVICIKDYMTIIHQLDELGVECFSVFDGRKIIPEHFVVINDRKEEAEKKPYHKGYVAGAFDMFHIGHLNLLRRAKERCNYLIVGVMSDERMYELKGKNPVIPCSERMQVVAGCRYVDEVVDLPIDRASISDAYEMVHFDCMFSGDDHVTDPAWLSEQEYLRSQGSDIVFVPYTKEQSSSAIRGKL